MKQVTLSQGSLFNLTHGSVVLMQNDLMDSSIRVFLLQVLALFRNAVHLSDGRESLMEEVPDEVWALRF